jgi:hypothetical protein
MTVVSAAVFITIGGRYDLLELFRPEAPPTHVVAVIAVAGMASVDGQHWALHWVWWIGAEHRTGTSRNWVRKREKNGSAPPRRRYKIGTKF